MAAEAARKQVMGRSCISVSRQTKDSLDSIKHSGQSYNGVIEELFKFWRDKKGEYWTRRREQRAAESKRRKE